MIAESLTVITGNSKKALSSYNCWKFFRLAGFMHSLRDVSDMDMVHSGLDRM